MNCLIFSGICSATKIFRSLCVFVEGFLLRSLGEKSLARLLGQLPGLAARFGRVLIMLIIWIQDVFWGTCVGSRRKPP